jgi:TPP-dependent pyruvate/acetoin dehydrogenase alpha subunit
MNDAEEAVASADVERLYRSLLLVRRAEEEIARIYPSDKIKSPVHLAIGQEAISVGVCDALRPDDVAGGTYRSHAVYMAKGGDLNAMMAEMYGKVTGCARGKGGSMHLIAMDHLVLGSSAVVGTTIPVAAGYALALKRERRGRVAVTFFGDGATEEGCFHETLNFAKLHNLPMLFVCENNGFAIHEPIAKRWGAPDLCRRVEGFGLPTHRIPDGDIFAIRAATAAAIERIRHGGGPEFLECVTYRWREHVGPNEDFDQNYRDAKEREPWLARDQVPRLAAMLPRDIRTRIDMETEEAIAAAIRFAEQSPFPGFEELHAHVYAD